MKANTSITTTEKRVTTAMVTVQKRIAAKKAKFLEVLSEGHSVTYAARTVGVDRHTVYDWRYADSAFALAWDKALESGADAWEDMLYDAAKSGNVTAIIVGLKMRGRFVERQYVQVSHEDLRARLKELAPDLPDDEVEMAVQEAMKLLAAPRGG